VSRRPDDLIRLSEADRLARLYMEAEREILLQIDRAMARGNDLRYLRSMLDNVQAILENLLTGNRQWCEEAIPRVYIEAAKFADEMVGKAAGGFGAIHQQAVQVLAENTFNRLESVRQVIGRRAEDWYRQYALETTRQSIIGYKTWKQVATDFRDRLRTEGITGFQDARGRNWNMKTYAEMVARTTTMEAHLTGTANRLLEHGYDLVRISSHAGSCEKCAPWQGKVLSLTGKTPGYPTLEDARADGLFHPNRRHAYSLYVDLDAEIEVTERETTFAKGDDSNSGEVQQDIGSAVPVDSIPSAAKRGISKALAEALAHGARTGAECLLTLDTSTGQPAYERVDGTAYSVQFPETFIEFLRKADRGSVILIHNHPSSSSFSNADLRTLAGYDSIKGMFVVGHDGTKYYAGKRDAQVTVETMLKTYEKFARQYYDEYYRLVNANRITPEQASKEFSHRVLESLAAELDLEYRRWDTP
jgi:hypothetical protein